MVYINLYAYGTCWPGNAAKQYPIQEYVTRRRRAVAEGRPAVAGCREFAVFGGDAGEQCRFLAASKRRPCAVHRSAREYVALFRADQLQRAGDRHPPLSP